MNKCPRKFFTCMYSLKYLDIMGNMYYFSLHFPYSDFRFQSCKHLLLMTTGIDLFPHYVSSFDVNVFHTRNCHHLTLQW